MTVSVRAVRASYRFAELGSSNPLDAFRVSKGFVRQSSASDDAAVVSLSGRKSSNVASDPSDTAEFAKSRPSGALKGLFGELQALGGRISAIQEEIANAPLGSTRQTALQDELSREQESFKQLSESQGFKRLRELFEKVDSALSQGVPRSDLARLLRADRSLLGDDFLGILQQGDVSGLLQVRSGLKQLDAIDITSPTAGGILQQLGASVLTALAGKYYQEEAKAPVTSTQSEAAVPLPVLQRFTMDIPGDVSFALNSVTGKDVARAIEAHAIPDQRYALSLVLDDDRSETAAEEKKRIEDERKKREELARGRFGAAFAAPIIGSPESIIEQ